MWSSPEKYEREVEDVNARLAKIEGFLEEKEARSTLAQFLRNN